MPLPVHALGSTKLAQWGLVLRSADLNSVELIRGPFLGAGRWEQSRAQRCEAQLSGFTSLSKILRPLSGP